MKSNSNPTTQLSRAELQTEYSAALMELDTLGKTIAQMREHDQKQAETITRQNTKIERLLEALNKYGSHFSNCPRYPIWSEKLLASGQIEPCDCGYDNALSETEQA